MKAILLFLGMIFSIQSYGQATAYANIYAEVVAPISVTLKKDSIIQVNKVVYSLTLKTDTIWRRKVKRKIINLN